MVESARQTYKMPLSNNGSLVTCSLQEFRHGLLRTVEHTGCIVGKAVGMTMLTGKHTARLGPLKELATKLFVKITTIVGDTVQIWSFHKVAPIATHHLCRMVIGHDIHDIILVGNFFLTTIRGQ